MTPQASAADCSEMRLPQLAQWSLSSSICPAPCSVVLVLNWCHSNMNELGYRWDHRCKNATVKTFISLALRWICRASWPIRRGSRVNPGSTNEAWPCRGCGCADDFHEWGRGSHSAGGRSNLRRKIKWSCLTNLRFPSPFCQILFAKDFLG